MKKLLTFLLSISLLLMISLPSFTQQEERLVIVKESDRQTTTKKRRGGFGFYGRILLGVGYGHNRERPSSYYGDVIGDGYYRVEDIDGFERDKDETSSLYSETISIPLNFNFGFHAGRRVKFLLFGTVAVNNLILRHHFLTIDERVSNSIDIKEELVAPNARERAAIWDIGGGIGFYLPRRGVDWSFTFEGHFSTFTSKFSSVSDALYPKKRSKGDGWGLTFQSAVEFPVLRRLLVLGFGVYLKYQQITFENTNDDNSGYLYSRSELVQKLGNTQRSRLDVYSFGIYLSASTLIFS